MLPVHEALQPASGRDMTLTTDTAARRRVLAALLLAAVPALRAQGAAPKELLGEWPTVHLQGQGRMRFLGLQVYDIRLWTTEPSSPAQDWPGKALALEIEYARNFAARMIAERSLEEMRRSGPVAADVAESWLRTMSQVFPDVKPGDRITGVQRPEGLSRFFHNGNLRGEVRDAEFTRRFFGIWLGESTSEPSLRNSLLGRR
jgi:hypothetical protein